MVFFLLLLVGARAARISSATAPLRGYADAARACGAVVTQPGSAQAWRTLGRLLHGKGRLEAGRACLAHACALDPADAEARVALANVLRSAGRFAESAEALHIGAPADQSLQYYRCGGPLAARGGAHPPDSRAAIPGGEVLVTHFADSDECEWAIAVAERFNRERGGWGNPPPRFAPAGTVADEVRAPHMLVADCPELLSWFNAKLESVVWPVLAAQFGQEAASDLWCYDAFLLKFDAAPSRAGLGVHVDDDGLGLSINVLLSGPDAFEGGGTLFYETGAAAGGGDAAAAARLSLRQGEMLSHHGGLRHASIPTSAGSRHILVAFLRSQPLIAAPPAYVSLDHVCRATMREVQGWQAQGAEREAWARGFGWR